MKVFTPADWFWIVGSDIGRWFSSAAGGYVTALPGDATPTRIANEQELWDVLDAAGVALPAGATVSDARKTTQVAQVDGVLFKVAFSHENRIRAIEGKAAISVAQFKAALKALI